MATLKFTTYLAQEPWTPTGTEVAVRAPASGSDFDEWMDIVDEVTDEYQYALSVLAR